MAWKGFKTNVLFQNEEIENIVITILILVGLKSFEFIIKTLLTSTRQQSVNTGKYALEIAADQAYNPLNYIRWWRGRPDFNHEGDKDFRKPIPLSRATLAVLICFMVLLTEAAFFYANMSKTRNLTVKDLTLSIQTSLNHKEHPFKKNFCTPIKIDTGRAQMTAVFAFCNKHTEETISAGATGTSGNQILRFEASQYWQSVSLTKGSTVTTSKTTFSLLVPDQKQHLVVPYNGTNALVKPLEAEVKAHLENDRKCQLNLQNITNGEYSFPKCPHDVEVDHLMEMVLSYTELNLTSGEVGHDAGNNVVTEKKQLNIGVIEEHKISMVALIAVTGTMFVFAVLCHVFVQNNNADVIAAMMREKTLQDMRVPAFSMDEEIIRLDVSTDANEGKSLQRTVHHRQSVDMAGSVVSGASDNQNP